jgi:hypothetical protein
MNNSLIKVTTEDTKKKSLQQRITVRRKKLVALITKCEELRVELDLVQQEYTVRVGKLFHKTNQQDLDIIYYNNIIDLMSKGMSYADAVQKLDDTFYAQQRKLDEEREQMKRAQQLYEMHIGTAKKSDDPQIKNLWKQLVSKFHPDLVQDTKEKSRREEIMKLINRAYQEQNVESLKRLQNEANIELDIDNTIADLERVLVDIENQIIEQEEVYIDLKTSEWYQWKINIARAKKKDTDVFADIEHNLLNEIVRKMDVVNGLREEVEKMKSSKKEH